ncbi:MAG: alanine racemase [Synergistaceae bacterium]|nr:alanine racemase [Synergistaceae bacterium]
MKNRVRVDYGHVAENARRIADYSGKKILAVVKNDAYNLGIEGIVDTLRCSGINCFAVASMDEALSLKELFPDVYALVFNPADDGEIKSARERGVALSVTGERWFYEHADSLSGIDLHLKINVGMNRFGISGMEAAKRIVTDCGRLGLSLVGLFTHLPLAEESDLSGHDQEVELFCGFYERLSPLCDFQFIHAENTAATLLRDSRLDFCNFVRPGAMLFGCSSRERVNWLLPTVYVSSAVIDLREAPKDGHLGYGYKFFAPRDMTVAILPIGYGHGLSRARKAAPVFINGSPYRIVSKIFLSHTFVEVDGRVKIGDEAEIYGDNVRIDDLSSAGAASNSEQMLVVRLLR